MKLELSEKFRGPNLRASLNFRAVNFRPGSWGGLLEVRGWSSARFGRRKSVFKAVFGGLLGRFVHGVTIRRAVTN